MKTHGLISFKKIFKAGVASLILTGSADIVKADISYPNVGTPNPVTYNFTATTTGDIIAYFAGSTAGYDNELGMLVNGVSTGNIGLDDHTSNIGDSFDLGYAHAGDILTFVLQVNSLNANVYSDPTLNTSYDLDDSDGHNHVYSVAYNTADPTFGSIPFGTYVGFEDQSFPNSDFNYHDENFIFAGVTSAPQTVVPEPTTVLAGALMLVPFGAGALRMLRKRQNV
jgi:hypothetical protein